MPLPGSLKYLCEFGTGSSCRYSRRYPRITASLGWRPSRFVFRGFLDNLPVCIEHSLCESMCVNEALGLRPPAEQRAWCGARARGGAGVAARQSRARLRGRSTCRVPPARACPRLPPSPHTRYCHSMK